MVNEIYWNQLVEILKESESENFIAGLELVLADTKDA